MGLFYFVVSSLNYNVKGESRMKKTYTQSAEEVLQGLGVGAEGLTTAEAQKRLEQ